MQQDQFYKNTILQYSIVNMVLKCKSDITGNLLLLLLDLDNLLQLHLDNLFLIQGNFHLLLLLLQGHLLLILHSITF